MWTYLCERGADPSPLFPSGGTGFLDRVAQEVLKMQEPSSHNLAIREYAAKSWGGRQPGKVHDQ